MLSLFAGIILTSSALADGDIASSPPTNFIPKRIYTNTTDKLWDVVLNTLEDSRIAVVSSDKTSGIVQTDYIAGKNKSLLAGFGGTQSTRCKFNLSLRPQSDGTVKLNIICTIEATVTKLHVASQWVDVSRKNPASVKKIETSLYYDIEKRL